MTPAALRERRPYQHAQHLGPQRAWKRRKRREWKAVLDAINVWRIGCAHTNTDYFKFLRMIRRMTERQSVKEWGQ